MQKNIQAFLYRETTLKTGANQIVAAISPHPKPLFPTSREALRRSPFKNMFSDCDNLDCTPENTSLSLFTVILCAWLFSSKKNFRSNLLLFISL